MEFLYTGKLHCDFVHLDAVHSLATKLDIKRLVNFVKQLQRKSSQQNEGDKSSEQSEYGCVKVDVDASNNVASDGNFRVECAAENVAMPMEFSDDNIPISWQTVPLRPAETEQELRIENTIQVEHEYRIEDENKLSIVMEDEHRIKVEDENRLEDLNEHTIEINDEQHTIKIEDENRIEDVNEHSMEFDEEQYTIKIEDEDEKRIEDENEMKIEKHIIKVEDEHGIKVEYQDTIEMNNKHTEGQVYTPMSYTEGEAYTPMSDTEGEAYTPVSNTEGEAYTPVSNTEREAYTPVSNTEGEAHTPVSNTKGEVYTPVSNTEGEAYTQVSNTKGEAHTPVSNTDGEAYTQVSNIEGEAYTQVSNTEGGAYTPVSNTEGEAYTPVTNTEGEAYTPVTNTEGEAYTPVSNTEGDAHTSVSCINITTMRKSKLYVINLPQFTSRHNESQNSIDNHLRQSDKSATDTNITLKKTSKSGNNEFHTFCKLTRNQLVSTADFTAHGERTNKSCDDLEMNCDISKEWKVTENEFTDHGDVSVTTDVTSEDEHGIEDENEHTYIIKDEYAIRDIDRHSIKVEDQDTIEMNNEHTEVYTPMSDTEGEAYTPVSNSEGEAYTPVSNTEGDAYTPLSNTEREAYTPVSNTEGEAHTSVSRINITTMRKSKLYVINLPQFRSRHNESQNSIDNHLRQSDKSATDANSTLKKTSKSGNNELYSFCKLTRKQLASTADSTPHGERTNKSCYDLGMNCDISKGWKATENELTDHGDVSVTADVTSDPGGAYGGVTSDVTSDPGRDYGRVVTSVNELRSTAQDEGHIHLDLEGEGNNVCLTTNPE